MADPISAVVVFTGNVNVNSPTLNSDGLLAADGAVVGDQDVVLCIGQNNSIENGPRLYNKTANTLTRPDGYASGATIVAPFYVEVTGGDTYAGTTWGLASPSSVVVDATATTWTNAVSGAGVGGPNRGLFGPVLPYASDGVETLRTLTPYDLPLLKGRASSTTYFPLTIPGAATRKGYLSDYISPTAMWASGGALLALLDDYNTVEVDRALELNGALTIPSGKRIEFTGSGRGGPTRIVQKNPAASVFVFDNRSKIDMRGLATIEYPLGANAGVKAIRGTNVSRLHIEALETNDVPYALYLDGTLDDILIDSVGVDNPALGQVPLFVGQTSTTGQESVRVGRVRNQPNVTFPGDADLAYTPHIHGRNVVASGAMTANHALTIASSNRIGSAEFVFFHNATGGFVWDVAGLVTLARGQRARVGFYGDGKAVLLGLN